MKEKRNLTARISSAALKNGELIIKKVFIYEQQGYDEVLLKESNINEKLAVAIKGGKIILDI